MTRRPSSTKRNVKEDLDKQCRPWFILSLAGVVTLIIALSLWLSPEPEDPPSLAETPEPVSQVSSVSEKRVPTGQRPSVTVAALPEAPPTPDAPEVDDNVPPPAADGEYRPEPVEFEPTPEQELHYEKTRMFMAEARESLPLIGIRAFNTIEAARKDHQAAIDGTEAATSGGRDNRGLQDGEVWVRIDPARSAEHKEIMAQTADLYRVNTGFEGDVTVVLWVGGQPRVHETFGSPW